MLTHESVSSLEISQDLKDQINSLIDTVANQKTSFSELVEINNACSKDNERLRGELELSRQEMAEIMAMKDSVAQEAEILRSNSETELVQMRQLKTDLESANLKIQAIKQRFGV